MSRKSIVTPLGNRWCASVPAGEVLQLCSGLVGLEVAEEVLLGLPLELLVSEVRRVTHRPFERAEELRWLRCHRGHRLTRSLLQVLGLDHLVDYTVLERLLGREDLAAEKYFLGSLLPHDADELLDALGHGQQPVVDLGHPEP